MLNRVAGGAVFTTARLLVACWLLTACSRGTAPGTPPSSDPHDGIVQPGEYDAAIVRLGRNIPLPPGSNFASVQGRDAVQEESGLLATLAYNASCQWYAFWLDALERGDDRKLSKAQKIVNEIPRWRWFSGSPDPIFAEIAEETQLGGSDTLRQQLEVNC